MKILFFGYLAVYKKILIRILSITISIFIPILYYKKDENVLIEDIVAKFMYSFQYIDLILIILGPILTIICSFLLYKLIHNKNEHI